MDASTDSRQTNTSDELEIMERNEVGWNQILGNPYRYGLHPDMLQPGGYRYTGMFKVVGQKAYEAPIAVTVNFDEKYVIAYLRKYVLEKLLPPSYNEFQKVLGKVWQDWQQG